MIGLASTPARTRAAGVPAQRLPCTPAASAPDRFPAFVASARSAPRIALAKPAAPATVTPPAVPRSKTHPTLASATGLPRYLKEIHDFPVLDFATEQSLAQRWRRHGDLAAAHRLITSHLRLVAKMAAGYRGYGLPLSELISEGNI